jgi:hypothetical protein
MEVDLNELWTELQQSSNGQRALLVTKWQQKRYEKLCLFRQKSNDLVPQKVVELVQWEDVIPTKGYFIDRNLAPLYEGAVSSAYRARKQFSSEPLFCKVYQIKKFCEAHGITNLNRQIANLTLLKNPRMVAYDKAFEVKNTQKMYLFMRYPSSGSVTGKSCDHHRLVYFVLLSLSLSFPSS